VSKSASTSSVYRVTELIGTSKTSWEDAVIHAVACAGNQSVSQSMFLIYPEITPFGAYPEQYLYEPNKFLALSSSPQ